MIEPQKGHSIRKTDFKTQYIVLSTRIFCLYTVCQITFYPFWGRIIFIVIRFFVLEKITGVLIR